MKSFAYTWNGEKRLIKAEELVAPTNRQPYVVSYAYDYRGRMIWKTIAPSTGSPIKTTTYVWDDYNIIAEHTTTGIHSSDSRQASCMSGKVRIDGHHWGCLR